MAYSVLSADRFHNEEAAFAVRMGTIFESSYLPLRLWLRAIHLLCTSKIGVSTRQLSRSGWKASYASNNASDKIRLGRHSLRVSHEVEKRSNAVPVRERMA